MQLQKRPLGDTNISCLTKIELSAYQLHNLVVSKVPPLTAGLGGFTIIFQFEHILLLRVRAVLC